jgi:hypothetical protein
MNAYFAQAALLSFSAIVSYRLELRELSSHNKNGQISVSLEGRRTRKGGQGFSKLLDTGARLPSRMVPFPLLVLSHHSRYSSSVDIMYDGLGIMHWNALVAYSKGLSQHPLGRTEYTNK